MTPVEMYEVLKKKYTELLDLEKAAHEKATNTGDHGRRGSHNGDNHHGHHAGHHDHTGEHHGHSHGADHSGGKPSRHTTPPGKHKPTILLEHEYDAQIQQAEEDVLSHEMQLVMEDITDLGLGDFDHTYTTTLVHKVFNVDKYEHLHNGTKAEDSGEHHYGRNNEQHDAFHCHVCAIHFESKQDLDVHYEHSDLHRKNLKNREKRLEDAHTEAIRLTALAKNVMNTLWAAIPIKEEVVQEVHPVGSYDAVVAALNAKEAHHSHVRYQWKHALDHVLHRRLVNKFSKMLETRINVPHGVEMMYEGSKYFYRNKTTYDLRYLLHVGHNILELVPHYVPFNHDKSVLEEEASENGGFIACKRIYLDYNELIKAFFGYNIAHTELTEGLTVGEAPHMQKLKGSFKCAEVAALDVYVTNRIKIHKSHGHGDALFFDLHGINHEILLKELPKRFAPVPVELEVIRNIWEQRTDGVHKDIDITSSGHNNILACRKSEDENDVA